MLRKRKALLVATLVLAAAQAAYTNTLPALPSIEHSVILCTSQTSCQSLADVTNGSPLSYSNTVTAGGAQITLIGTADANSTTGDLKAFESYILPVSTPVFYQANTGARLRYIMTISSPLLNGTAGSFVPVYDVTGTTTASALGQMDIASQDSIGTAPLSRQGPFFSGSAHLVFNPISFHYGAPFYFSPGLAAVTFPNASILSGTADYSHTASLRGFELFDSNNSPIFNASISSDIGGPIPILTPEPGSSLMVGLGVLCIVSIIRSRTARQ